MISSFRNFAKSKFAGLLVFIMIIPFVFWGMGSMFSSGNNNNIAKINKTNISTQEFVDYLNNSGIPQETIRKNLDRNIIQEILSSLVSITLLDLEIKDFDIIISENTLFKKIKKNKNFQDENGTFKRTKYEKFLLENNLSAPAFELRLKKRELQKNLFDYIGAGTASPKFLINKLFEEENKMLEIDFINLENFYKKKENITDQDLEKFINENQDQLKVEYIDFKYSIINPKNLLDTNEFNQLFFDKIDQIEIDISNELEFETIVKELDIEQIKVQNFRYSVNENEIEKKIFELRKTQFDIFEYENDYILYEVKNVKLKEPNISNQQIKDEILQLVYQKNKFDYNEELLKKIKNKKFSNEDFLAMSQNKIETTKLNSIKDNNKFEINAVEVLYSLPVNSFTLINDENKNIFLAKIKDFQTKEVNNNSEQFNEYIQKQNTNNKNILLKSYDLFLNKKYNVVLNQKTIERVENFFK
jgi:peptidyl-prolyl cis-trans isomerase D